MRVLQRTKWPNALIKLPRRSRTWTSGRRSCGGIFDFEGKQKRLTEVETLLTDPKVWNDPKRAQDLGREKKSLEATVTGLAAIASSLRDARGLFEMARGKRGTTLVSVAADVAELEGSRRSQVHACSPTPRSEQLLLDIQSGSGGAEAQDWAAMLRADVRQVLTAGYHMEVLESRPGGRRHQERLAQIGNSYAYHTCAPRTACTA
jgi:peptide chain release factor 2